jgi:hypothetical protein
LKLKNINPKKVPSLKIFLYHTLKGRENLSYYHCEDIPKIDDFLSRHAAVKRVKHYNGRVLKIEGVDYQSLIRHLSFTKPCIWRAMVDKLTPMYYRNKKPFMTVPQFVLVIKDIKAFASKHKLTNRSLPKLAARINKRLRNYDEY